MQNVAFLTYNTVGNGHPNGCIERDGRKAFLIQNPQGERWVLGVGPAEIGYILTSGSDIDRRREEIAVAQVTEHKDLLEKMDRVYVYLGAGHAMRKIAQLIKGIPGSKLTFVACDCNWTEKMRTLESSGFGDCPRLMCECGGHRTMERLLEAHLEKGEP